MEAGSLAEGLGRAGEVPGRPWPPIMLPKWCSGLVRTGAASLLLIKMFFSL